MQNFPTVHAEQCKGCGLCVENCPRGVLRIRETLNSLGYSPAEYDADCGGDCSGCGVCFYSCPEPGAISLRRAAVHAIPAVSRPASARMI